MSTVVKGKKKPFLWLIVSVVSVSLTHPLCSSRKTSWGQKFKTEDLLYHVIDRKMRERIQKGNKERYRQKVGLIDPLHSFNKVFLSAVLSPPNSLWVYQWIRSFFTVCSAWSNHTWKHSHRHKNSERNLSILPSVV